MSANSRRPANSGSNKKRRRGAGAGPRVGRRGEQQGTLGRGAQAAGSERYAGESLFQHDNLRWRREEPTMALRTRDGKKRYRDVVGPGVTQVEIPFQLTNSGTKPTRFYIGTHFITFHGQNVYVGANGNGRVDAGEAHLKGEITTPVFAPGETKCFVYRGEAAPPPPAD